jgi:hypothetical protein
VRRTLRTTLIAATLAAGGWACGGGNDCAGFITINVTPAECEARAKQFGCPSFEVNGPSCGLSGCASCEGL